VYYYIVRSKKVKVKDKMKDVSGVGMSDLIASFINDLLAETDGTAELQRAELANKFNCVPSQINYVISTRFSPERGYVVESRRGGGGYIRISRVRMDPERLLIHTVNSVGTAIDCNTASALLSNLLSEGVIDKKAARMILSAIGNPALKPVPVQFRDGVRASILKQMLVNIM
jgi:transcriptional regulator CtsR